MSSLTEWEEAWRSLGVAPPPGLRDRLVDAYGESGRAYHNLRHLDECFARMESARPLLRGPAEDTLALWFHDAVYDPRRSDNESLSAAWAERTIRDAGLPMATAEAVRDLILATRHVAPPRLGDESYLIDIDLAILGAGPERFDEYEGQVRDEYAWVDGETFRQGRATILRGFLARPSLYATEFFRDLLEARARENLARSLRRLDV